MPADLVVKEAAEFFSHFGLSRFGGRPGFSVASVKSLRARVKLAKRIPNAIRSNNRKIGFMSDLHGKSCTGQTISPKDNKSDVNINPLCEYL